MHHIASKRYIFFIIGITLLFLSPLLVIFVGIMVPMTFYFEPYAWFYYTPTKTFILYGIACAILIVTCALLFFSKVKKWSIVLGSVLVIVSVSLFYAGSLHYVMVSSDTIHYRPLFTKEVHVYSWDEIERVRFVEVLPHQKGVSTFYFYMNDGEEIALEQRGDVISYAGTFLGRFRRFGIDFTYEDFIE